MNKTFILLLVISSASSYAETCTNKVDPKKAVVFVDTNGSYLEFREAKKAACTRGETFIVIPHGEQHSIQVGIANNANMAAYRAIEKAKCYTAERNAETCLKLRDKQEKLDADYWNVVRSKPKVDKNVFKSELNKLAQQNVAITALALSGHDGGGSIHGGMGSLNKFEVTSAFYEAYKGKTNLSDQLETVLMWGCFTANPSEVHYWKSTVPSLKILAGFNGIGPANDRPASGELMEDILVKSRMIADITNKKKLEATIKSLTYIHYTAAGMYVNAKCEEGDSWYYRHYPDETDGAKRRQFTSLNNLASCNELGEAISNNRRLFNPYYEGLKEIPLETRGTELRQIYTGARELAHCIDKKDLLIPDRVGLLLFYNGVKENFKNVFSKEMKDGQSGLGSLDKILNDVKSKYLGSVQSMGDWWNDREYLSDLVHDFEKIKKDASKVDLNNLSKMSRTELKETLSKLQPIMDHRIHNRIPELKTAMGPITKAYKIIDSYLYKLDPACMDFLEWHEAVPGTKPKARCKL